jgi:elongation factor 1 alpha-like protein
MTAEPSIRKPNPQICSNPFSFADFFKDSPLLNVPAERQAVFIAPVYPRGGLLGGSSDGAPKMSKLQALAAARKKKAQEQRSSGSSSVDKPMGNLTLKKDQPMGNGKMLEKNSIETTLSTKLSSRGFPLRKRKDSNPHEKAPTAAPAERDSEQSSSDTPMENTPLDQAQPSAFASTMFSNAAPVPPRQHLDNIFTLPYVATTATTSTDPFAGPSPDDVVIAAQSKGSTNSAKAKK